MSSLPFLDTKLILTQISGGPLQTDAERLTNPLQIWIFVIWTEAL